MTRTFYIETLGCAKNAVDSDKAAQGLIEDGLVATEDPTQADVVVVNTCAFIDAAREESINTTLELSGSRKAGAKLVVTGCMAQRYEDELKTALPEVDAIVGFAHEANIAEQIFEPVTLKSKPIGVRDLLDMPRPKPDSPWAYLKVAEGCNRNCAFCAIPTFRGKQRSRSMESIVDEARMLVNNGVKEIVLVAQDIAWYGRDVDDDATLSDIMREIDKLRGDGLEIQRLVYIYPSELRGDLLETMLTLPSSVPYFDLSLQHAHPELLRHMKRPGSSEKFHELISTIREAKPEAVFRSNFIVGFPGETETHHNELVTFIEKADLTWTGFFPYSHEKDTTAYTYSDQIDSELAQMRTRELQRAQDHITQRLLLSTVGSRQRVMVDSMNTSGSLTTRGFDSAPEIDGVIHVDTQGSMYSRGDFIDVEIAEVSGVDRHAQLFLS
ncbi:MAG TPA: 30S ribosomal protein S12 methylthiotransferase RimO [Acidimicrobiia bacterium]|nr:30S ribosomal protein S12 methylthiotransferase RimO [Acidimicrobiia bacterium]